MPTAVSVLVVDESQGLSPAHRAALEHLPLVHTIAEADLAAQDADVTVALVFVDEVRLADGLARIADLRERLPGIRVLAAFGALLADDLRALLAAGADAVIARASAPREVSAAILALADGADRLVAPEASPSGGDALGLTPREAEVLRFLSAGFSNKEVARRLTLSVRTVETHRLNLRRKTQTGRLKDLVSLARQLGLAPVVDDAGRPAAHGRAARH